MGGGSAAPTEPTAEWNSAEKRVASAGPLLTALPDALLRQVLSLLPQRAALHAALASRTLREAALSDELWTAWGGAVPFLNLYVCLILGDRTESCTVQPCGVSPVLHAAYREGLFTQLTCYFV